MGINLGDVFPNFSADTTVGKISFNEYVGDSLVLEHDISIYRYHIWLHCITDSYGNEPIKGFT